MRRSPSVGGFIYIYIFIYVLYIYNMYIYIFIHPRMADDSRIFSTTGRILFYNSWKENCGKLQMHYSEFHQWLIHLNTKQRFVLPLQFSTGPSKLFKFPEIVSRLPSFGGYIYIYTYYIISYIISIYIMYKYYIISIYMHMYIYIHL